jgi:hypothetical protein
VNRLLEREPTVPKAWIEAVLTPDNPEWEKNFGRVLRDHGPLATIRAYRVFEGPAIYTRDGTMRQRASVATRLIEAFEQIPRRHRESREIAAGILAEFARHRADTPQKDAIDRALTTGGFRNWATNRKWKTESTATGDLPTFWDRFRDRCVRLFRRL